MLRIYYAIILLIFIVSCSSPGENIKPPYGKEPYFDVEITEIGFMSAANKPRNIAVVSNIKWDIYLDQISYYWMTVIPHDDFITVTVLDKSDAGKRTGYFEIIPESDEFRRVQVEVYQTGTEIFYSFEVDKTDLYFESECYEPNVLQVIAENVSWTHAIEGTGLNWISTERSEHGLNVYAHYNKEDNMRMGRIFIYPSDQRFSPAIINVYQEGLLEGIFNMNVSPNMLNFDARPNQDQLVTVDAVNTGWTVADFAEEWLTVVKVADDRLSVSAAPNNGQPRTAKIVVKATHPDVEDCEIAVVQQSTVSDYDVIFTALDMVWYGDYYRKGLGMMELSFVHNSTLGAIGDGHELVLYTLILLEPDPSNILPAGVYPVTANCYENTVMPGSYIEVIDVYVGSVYKKYSNGIIGDMASVVSGWLQISHEGSKHEIKLSLDLDNSYLNAYFIGTLVFPQI